MLFSALSISCGKLGATDPGAADGALYVAAGSPQRSAAAVDMGPGRARFVAVQELVVDMAPADPQFPDALTIAVGSEGRFFTYDTLADVSLRALSAEGVADGDWSLAEAELDAAPLDGLITIGASGDRLAIAQWSADLSAPGRLSVFAPDGSRFRAVETVAGVAFPHPLGDGRTVIYELYGGVLALIAEDGSEAARFTVFPRPEGRRAGPSHLWPKEAFAVGGDRVYATAGATYEVVAFDLNTDVAWVLDAPWSRIPIPEHMVAKTNGRTERAGRAMAANLAEDADVIWPDHFPALAGIETDDRGRLFVFPFVVDTQATEFPVDVYSRDGELIGNGTLPFQGWDAYRGEHVYRVEHRSGRTVIVRYRLQLPATVDSAVSAGQ
ncbi:MAG TPA: hypothetical protein QGG47_14505 [Acidobacteriota bacterium]|nr:hypothetical protein [Acidobacteriota bacterium]